MITVNITGNRDIQSNANRYKQEIKRKVKAALVEIALVEIETGAKQKLTSDGHIDTGRLRASIHTEHQGSRGDLNVAIGENDVVVGTAVHYAIYVERMDSYLKWAFEKAKPKIANAISQEVNL